jgi:hypothetical protein
MNVKLEFPNKLVKLLAKQINNTIDKQEYIDWAISMLESQYDGYNLRILAGLTSNYSSSETEAYFNRVIKELNIIVPEHEVILRAYLIEIAKEIICGITLPINGVNMIHKYVLTPLEHPRDLMGWCYLWESLEPTTFDLITNDKMDQTIIDFAKRYLIDRMYNELE